MKNKIKDKGLDVEVGGGLTQINTSKAKKCKHPIHLNNRPNVRFISTFENYDKEECGLKRNHVVKRKNLARSKWGKLYDFSQGNPCTITIQKGYTKTCFTENLTDVTEHNGRVIMSW